MKLNFSYTVAAESSSSSPCTNVPVQCPLCPRTSPAMWKYFLKTHLEIQHPNATMENHSSLMETVKLRGRRDKKNLGEKEECISQMA